MNILDWLSYFGIPTLVFGAVIGYFAKQIKKNKQEQDAIKAGVQALLRNEMISVYNKYNEKGYAPIYAKENFDNMYKNYHSLGLNGVMDGIHEDFMELPTEKQNKEKED